jgi:hypothetical protein
MPQAERTKAKKAATPKRKNGVQLAFRVDDELVSAIDRAAEELQKQSPGLHISRSEAARILLHKALMGTR